MLAYRGLFSILVLFIVQGQCQIWGIQIVISQYELGGTWKETVTSYFEVQLHGAESPL